MKYLAWLLLLPSLALAQQQIVNIGSGTGTGTGDPAWLAFTKMNANFSQLFGTLGVGSFPGPSNLSMLFNCTPTEPAGWALARFGIDDGTHAGWKSNPVTGDCVPIYGYISDSSGLGRNRIWGINTNVDKFSGNGTTAWSAEFDLNQFLANAPDPHTTGHAIGVDVVSSGTFAPSAPYSSLSQTLGDRWKHGVWLEGIGGQPGSTAFRLGGAGPSASSVDYGLDLSNATINIQGVRVGPTPAAQVASGAFTQFSNGNDVLFLQRFTDTSPTGHLLSLANAANNAELAYIDVNGLMYGTSAILGPSSTAQSFLIDTSSTTPLLQSNNTNSTGGLGVSRWSADANAPTLALGKSRGASVGTQAVVSSGDRLGNIYFVGSDGTSLQTGAAIVAIVDGSPGAGAMPTKLQFRTTPSGSATSGSRAEISPAGGFISTGTGGTATGCSLSAQTTKSFAGQYTSGTAGTCTVSIPLPSLETGQTAYSCFANDRTTTTDVQNASASGATLTVTGTTASGDVIQWGCIGY